jgi:trypsin
MGLRLRLAATLSATVLAAAGALVGAAPSQAIVGGSSVKDGGYRFMASIQTAGSSGADGHFCGGSVIAARWVLTAAHCMTEEDGSTTRPGTLQVVVGRTDLKDTSRGQKLKVDRVLVHPSYARTGTHDVALLRTTRDMRVPRIKPVGTSNALERDGSTVVVTGWGTEFFGSPSIPSRMKSVRLSVVGDSQCTLNTLMGFNKATEVCAEALGGDSCQGDSGGPLFGRLADGRRVQVGVVSYGLGCATPEFPGVYAEVNNTSIRSFIRRHAGV